jgi:hypothetical protein
VYGSQNRFGNSLSDMRVIPSLASIATARCCPMQSTSTVSAPSQEEVASSLDPELGLIGQEPWRRRIQVGEERSSSHLALDAIKAARSGQS